MNIFPAHRSGKWALYFIVAMFVLYTIGILSGNLYKNVPAGNGLVADIPTRPLLAIPMLLGILSGVVSFVFSLTALFKDKERSLLVYLSALIGLFLVVLLVGELFSNE